MAVLLPGVPWWLPLPGPWGSRAAGPAPGSPAAAPVALRRRTDASCRTAGEGEMFAHKPGVCVFHQLLLLLFNRLMVSSG